MEILHTLGTHRPAICLNIGRATAAVDIIKAGLEGSALAILAGNFAALKVEAERLARQTEEIETAIRELNWLIALESTHEH